MLNSRVGVNEACLLYKDVVTQLRNENNHKNKIDHSLTKETSIT